MGRLTGAVQQTSGCESGDESLDCVSDADAITDNLTEIGDRGRIRSRPG
jgi:hypothetical protein